MNAVEKALWFIDWQRFLPRLDRIPGQIGRTAYGVSCNSDDAGSFEYVCGVDPLRVADGLA